MPVTNNEELVKRIARLAKQNQELEEHIKNLEKMNEKLTRDNEKIKALYEKISPDGLKEFGEGEKEKGRLNSIWRQCCLQISMVFQGMSKGWIHHQ